MNRPAIRRSGAADLPEMIALWQTVFGDPPAFTERFYENFGADCAIVAETDGKIVAMIHPLPAALAQNGQYTFGVYIYALATAPDYRSRGIASALLQAAESSAFAHPLSLDWLAEAEEGLIQIPRDTPAFSLLIPAEDSLFAYYRQKGYIREARVVSYEAEDYPSHLRQGLGSEPFFLKPESFYSFAQRIYEPTPPPTERALWKPLAPNLPEREPILSHFMQ